jgi:hypothetical protein
MNESQKISLPRKDLWILARQPSLMGLNQVMISVQPSFLAFLRFVFWKQLFRIENRVSSEQLGGTNRATSLTLWPHFRLVSCHILVPDVSIGCF